MGKVGHSIACPYCSKTFARVSSLANHWSHKLDCARKRRQDLQQLDRDLTQTVDEPDIPDPDPYVDPAPDLPADIPLQPREESADVEMADAAPASPNRGSSVAIEEIEDEDAGVPRLRVSSSTILHKHSG
jgi:hypothetical protein